MLIPPNELSPETLQAIVEEYISREGTDYGIQEVSWETKVKQVMAQVDSGEVVITFNAEEGTCSLVSKDDAPFEPREGTNTDS